MSQFICLTNILKPPTITTLQYATLSIVDGSHILFVTAWYKNLIGLGATWSASTELLT